MTTLDDEQDALLEAIGLGLDTVEPEPARERVSAKIGRFTVLQRIGAGGMGVVYTAYDHELDRKVAIKVLPPDLADEEGEARIRKEAQALAKLSHPNVVAVYEVGRDADSVFVAMEFIDGATLGDWVAHDEPDWRAVVSHFSQAGRGLAAAHEVGLVHRDFKPGNAMRGRDGRVRVLDFGLARADASLIATTQEGASEHDDSGALALPLTRTGAIVGTPAYMAPEQFARGTVDARTDQFSFCVALYEALYGMRPFPGGSLGALAATVTAGEITAPPSSTSVPRWVEHVVRKGLAVAPSERHESMVALLDALAADPAVRRRRLWLVAGVVGLVGAAGWLGRSSKEDEAPKVVAAPPPPEPCTGPSFEEDALAGSWDSERRTQVDEALIATQVSYAAATSAAVTNQLDAYAEAWRVGRQEACRATHVRGEQSEELLDTRMRCLARRRAELDALVHVLAAADAVVTRNAADAIRALSPVSQCGDPSYLAATVPPPPPDRGQAVDAVRSALANAAALQAAGKYGDSLAILDQVTPEARETEYAPVVGETLALHGAAQRLDASYEAAEATLHEAIRTAYGAGDEETVLEAVETLVSLLGTDLRRPDEALQWAKLGQASLARAGTNDDLGEARLLSAIGAIERRRANLDEAMELQQRALEIRLRHYGEDDPALIGSYKRIADIHRARGEYEETLAGRQRVLALVKRDVGPDHPNAATAHNDLGGVYGYLGRYPEALEHHARALAIREKALGPDHPVVANALYSVGRIHFLQGDPEAALPFFERAVAIDEARLGPEHPNLATNLSALGVMLTYANRFEEALEVGLRALAIREKALGPSHPRLAESLSNVGTVYYEWGQPREAATWFRRATELWEQVSGEDHPDVAYGLTCEGEALAAMGDCESARPKLERALEIRIAKDVSADYRARTEFQLARCSTERGRARELAQAARARYAEAGAGFTDEVAEIDRWLAGPS